jgi:peptidoglycan LD-endopeptidase CwlK
MIYEKRNLDNINKLASRTKEKALAWHEYCKLHKIEILIYETIRTKAKQREYIQTGASQTMKSYHLVGQALDFVPVNSRAQAMWDGYDSKLIQQAVRYAKELGFEWGGDWKSFVDKPHLQYNYKGYGTDTFETVSKAEQKTSINKKVEAFQSWLNKHFAAGLMTDGFYGPKTKKVSLKALQKTVGTTTDGIWGPKTKASTDTIRIGAKGDLVYILQGMLYSLGYDPKGFDGIFGKGTAAAVLSFQKDKRIAQDGIAGKNTFEKLFG